MGTQLDQVQPIEVITTSDFQQDFVMQSNGLPFDLTGLTEATVTLIQHDNKTLSVFKFSTSDITLIGDAKLGRLHLKILQAQVALLKITNGKDIDFVCTGPWGNQTFRAVAILSVKMASTGS